MSDKINLIIQSLFTIVILILFFLFIYSRIKKIGFGEALDEVIHYTTNEKKVTIKAPPKKTISWLKKRL